MAAIDRSWLELDAHEPLGGSVWSCVAARCEAWATQRRVALRDSVLLLPFAQLLAPARAAFAQTGRWVPRIETTQTLAASVGPAPRPLADRLSLDPAVDQLSAARLLRAQPWGRAWAQRDPRGFEHAVSNVVATAASMALAAAAVAPERRAAHWDGARALLGPQRGPGDAQRRLARVALEWVALTFEPSTDRLFALRPAAWMAVQAGGPEPLIETLLAAAADGTPCLVLDADARAALACAAAQTDHTPTLVLCDSFEHEAQCAASQVLVHLQRGQRPVALIAQDRVLVRRVRALLERARIGLIDETGWKLSTTRAAAQLMTLLRAAAPRASTDALFDWLKNVDDWPGLAQAPDGIDELELACRRKRLRRVGDLSRLLQVPQLRPWIEAINAALAPLQALSSAAPARWLEELRRALQQCGALSRLQTDDAGRQVLTALHLEVTTPTWREAIGQSVLDLPAFTAWLDGTLERHTFHPPPSARGAADVIITPLARAMLRHFGAIVFPGADDSRLGAGVAVHPLLPDALLQPLGLPDAKTQGDKELRAFGHVAGAPRLTLLRRRMDGGNPLADSPLVERLALELARRGHRFQTWHDPRPQRVIETTPLTQPAPAAAERLPSRLSASAAEALRDCPYRFFAQHVLRVREDEELDEDIEKRDYGTWLHAVLHAFHARRAAAGPASQEVARLRALGHELQSTLGLAEEQFVPFEASFEDFAPRYIAWLHARDAAGARWLQGEHALEIGPQSLGGTVLAGVIDRIDEVPGDELELIDYKTGSVDDLKKKVRQPLEDTQLAFYAALMRGHTRQSLRAVYLPLDGAQALKPISHPQVEHSAQALVAGLANDLQRLRDGAGMPALGEGRTCDYCEARGLCRRDHWTLGPVP